MFISSKKIWILSLYSFFAFSSTAFAVCEIADDSVAKGLYGHALSYYEMCTTNNPDSEDYYKLGSLYYRGLGLTYPDYGSATVFFKEAAFRGHAPSMLFLGLMAVKGEGLEAPDKIEGYKWFMLAAERPANKWIYGFDTADTPKSSEYLKSIGSSLSDDEKQKAASLAGIFKEEVIMRSAARVFDEQELLTFKENYSKDENSRKQALRDLKSKMSPASATTDNKE